MTHPSDTDPDLVGYIIGTSGTDSFQFVSTTGLMPGRLEYIVLRDFPDQKNGQSRKVNVLAQVTDIGVASRILDEDLNFDETVAILTGNFKDRPRVILDARIIGHLDGGSVRRPRFAAAPGHPVRRAGDDLLRAFFCHDIEHGIHVGHLIDRPDVDVQLDPNGLRRHLAIIAQTGAGKSYLAGRLLECLIELGATTIVLDPNSDYVQLRKIAADVERPYARAERTPFADRIDIYRIPGLTHYRYSDELVGPSLPFTVRFADLTAEEVLELAGVDERYIRIAGAVRAALSDLRRGGTDYGPQDLLRRLRRLGRGHEGSQADSAPDSEPTTDGVGNVAGSEAAAGGMHDEAPAAEPSAASEPETDEEGDHQDIDPGDFLRAVAYVQPLTQYTIWGQHNIDIERALQAHRATILDLAGGGRKVVEYTAARLLDLIWERALSGRLPYPVFVLLEEAHNLVPGRGQRTRASGIINTIASEGRKFHVFLIVVTQRPSKINEDTLSQCGSQIIMKITNSRDQEAIANAAEAASNELVSDLPGLNRGEAVVLGQLTRIPAVINITGRLSAEGGADIDLVAELQRALNGARTGERIKEAEGRTGSLPSRSREAEE
jgi:hypothetical protein